MLYTNNKKTIFVDNKQHINYNMKKFIRWLSDIKKATGLKKLLEEIKTV